MYRLSLLSFVLACGDPKEGQDTAAPTTNDTDTDTGPEEDRCIPQADDTFLMSGTVEYEDGTPAKGNTLLQMCSSVGCFSGMWGEDGGFCFKNLSTGHYSFVVFPQVGDPNTYASPIAFVSIENGDTELPLADPIDVPKYVASQTAATGAFDAGGGLTINVDTSTFEETTLHGVSVDPSTSGLPLSEFDGKTIAGLWYLGPAAVGGNTSTGDSGWTFEIDVSQNSSLSALTEGDTVSVYNASYSDHDWLEAGTATLNGSGILVSDSPGITVLSALLIVLDQ